jgi:hypothetical protein
MLQQVDYLMDKTGLLVLLINCRIEQDRILCGFAFFRGGLHGAIEVFDKTGQPFTIKIPESVAEIFTYQSFCNPQDKFTVYRQLEIAQ